MELVLLSRPLRSVPIFMKIIFLNFAVAAAVIALRATQCMAIQLASQPM